jgi:Cu/Ag efflux pump CusA
MVGGMISATVLTLVIIPSLYLIVNGWKLPGGGKIAA